MTRDRAIRDGEQEIGNRRDFGRRRQPQPPRRLAALPHHIGDRRGDAVRLAAAPRASRGAADPRQSVGAGRRGGRSEEHTSELQSLMRISYAVFCLKKKKKQTTANIYNRNER